MQCPSCDHQNVEEAEFCANCGKALPQAPIQTTPGGFFSRRTVLIVLAVVVVLFVSGASIALLIHSSQASSSLTKKSTPIPTSIPPTKVSISTTPTPTPTQGTTPTTTPIPFQITTIDLSVDPLSIAGTSCGTQLTVTYTATIHVLPKGPGGVVQFTYTTDGGRTSKTGVVQFGPGQTIMQYQFPASGTLELNGAFPGAGQVTTTSPSTMSSQAITPSGACTQVPTATP